MLQQEEFMEPRKIIVEISNLRRWRILKRKRNDEVPTHFHL